MPRPRARAKKRQAHKEYWKKNKAGDSGGQDARPQPTPEMDAGMIFSDNRRGVIRAAKGGAINHTKKKRKSAGVANAGFGIEIK